MPRASCDVCILRLYATDIQICRCGAEVASTDCRHWRPHHSEINGLCKSALIGCRMCNELWRHFFFKEQTPEQYASEPTFTLVPGTANQPSSVRLTGPAFQIGPCVHIFYNTGLFFRVVELTDESAQADEIVLALDFGISSPMIYEIEERRYILKKTSDYERLLTLFASDLLQLDDNSSPDREDVSRLRWSWVRKWMTECEEKHQICSGAIRANKLLPWFPTRLIDVRGTLDKSGRKRYLLIETARVTPDGHSYATLSHIWGSGPENQQPAYRTVDTNYPERTTIGIPRDELPPCFQDAIDVTARLEIPYLWIDSLCIIQGNEDDWNAEAGRMADVYSNSTLNLSATASSSSKDRFPSLVRTQRSPEQPMQEPRLHEPRFVSTEWTGRFAGMYQIFDPAFWADRVTSTRLASRGWIFQERALAPRVLHFASDQVLWECTESERAEEFPLGIPRRFIDSGHRGFKWQISSGALQNTAVSVGASSDGGNLRHEQHRILHEKWSKAIDTYSRCELTKVNDKLVAISGVARVLAGRFQDDYVAGLWRSNLAGGMCWWVAKMRRTTQDTIPSGLYARRWEISRRPVEKPAPSWSWASVDGEITMGPFVSKQKRPIRGREGYKTMSSLVSALKVDPNPVTKENEFGAVNQVEMQLSGTMYPLLVTVGEPLLDRKLSFEYIGIPEPAISVFLDQPEQYLKLVDVYFLPLIKEEYHIAPATTPTTAAAGAAATADPPPEGWITRLKQKGKNIFREDAAATSLRGSDADDAREAMTNIDFGLVQGIVVVRTENKKAYRRVGFHLCKEDTLERLRNGPDEGWLEGHFTLV